MLNTSKIYYGFNDVLIKGRPSSLDSRQSINLNLDLSKFKNPLFKEWSPLPVMSANMDTVTDIEMAFELLKRNWIPVLHKYVSIVDISKLFDMIDNYNNIIEKEKVIDYRNLFVSRGTSQADKEKLIERLDSESRIKSVCIDVANGHRLSIIDYVKKLKKSVCKDKILMVGNVGTSEMLPFYVEAGVDIIKAGIGPGSACITRVKTGVGTPQVSLIDELVTANKNKDILICSDGGCKNEGDIAKGFVAGADFVMIGGMLSGFKESPGVVEMVNGLRFKRFSGMAAKESQLNGVPNYGTEEGKTVMIPYKGKVYHKLEDIEGGIRSACTYTDSKTINNLKNATLIITNEQENTSLK